MQHPTSRPAAQTCGHHEQMHAGLRVQPRHWVAQASHAKTQGGTGGFFVEHKPRGLPSLSAAVKPRIGNLHIGCAFLLSRKPKGKQTSSSPLGHGHQGACMRGRGLGRHRNVPDGQPVEHGLGADGSGLGPDRRIDRWAGQVCVLPLLPSQTTRRQGGRQQGMAPYKPKYTRKRHAAFSLTRSAVLAIPGQRPPSLPTH